MYNILRGGRLIGYSRLETPCVLTGEARGVLETGPAFAEIRDRLAAQAAAVEAELAADPQTRGPPDFANDFREMLLLAGAGTDGFRDLSVVAPDGRVLNARVNGFAEVAPGRWVVAVAVNDGEFWRRAAAGTL